MLPVSAPLERRTQCTAEFFFIVTFFPSKKYILLDFLYLSTLKMDTDQDLVKKLRNEYPEQFMNLVKMHLSFCLDQSTDE